MGFRLLRPFLFSFTRRQRMIHEHAAWLTMMLREHRPAPRIPTRRVSQGGFQRLTRTPRGQAAARRWWEAALEQID